MSGLTSTSPLADDLVEVTGTNVSVTLTGVFSATVATFAVVSQQKSGVTVEGSSAPVSGSLLTLTVTGITISIANGAVTLGSPASGTNSLTVASLTTSGASYTAAAGSDFSLSLTAGPLSASGTVGFLYNSGSAGAGHEISDWTFAGVSGLTSTSPLADDLVEVTGTNVSVTLTGVFSATVADLRGRLAAEVGCHGSRAASAPVSGSLLTLTVTGITISIANGAVTLGSPASGTNSLTVASLTTSGASYTAAAGSDFSLSLTAGPLSASGTVGFLYNSGSAGAGHEISDWTFAGVSGLTSTSPLADDLAEVDGHERVGDADRRVQRDGRDSSRSSRSRSRRVTVEGSSAPVIRVAADVDGDQDHDFDRERRGHAREPGERHEQPSDGRVADDERRVLHGGGGQRLLVESLTAGPLSASGTVGFLYNSGSAGAGHEISDWTFAGVSGLTSTSPLADDLVEVTGTNVSVTLTGVFSATVATFAVVSQQKSGVTVEGSARRRCRGRC